MEELLNHIQTVLSGIKRNTGTVEEPVLETVLKEVQTDDGQLTSKVTLQLPAAYYDITRMKYSHAGDMIGIADTAVTIKLACRKADTLRWDTINRITAALSGTNGNTFQGLMKDDQVKTEYTDIFVYSLVFVCAVYDMAAVPTRTPIEKPEGVITFNIQ